MRRHNKKQRTTRKGKLGPNFTGQHLLHHPKTIKQLIETASLQQTDTVLEIGAGKGSLTFPIADQAGRVLAVEMDANFVELLRIKTASYPQVKIIQADIREMRLPATPFCVVANIPFSITTDILEKLLGAEGKTFQRAALILEKGAARRFTRPLTLDPRLLKWRMNFVFEMRAVVPRKHFAPPPSVDAAIVRVSRRDSPLVPVKEVKRFAAFAAYVLRDPRLIVGEALRGIFTPMQLKVTLNNAKVHREQTVASLSLQQWSALFHAMIQHAAAYRWPKG